MKTEIGVNAKASIDSPYVIVPGFGPGSSPSPGVYKTYRFPGLRQGWGVV